MADCLAAWPGLTLGWVDSWEDLSLRAAEESVKRHAYGQEQLAAAVVDDIHDRPGAV